MMNIRKWIAKRVNEFNWGQFIVSKVQFIFTLLILMEVYEWSKLTKIIVMIGGILTIWVFGAVFNKYLREDFQKENFKNTLYNK